MVIAVAMIGMSIGETSLLQMKGLQDTQSTVLPEYLLIGGSNNTTSNSTSNHTVNNTVPSYQLFAYAVGNFKDTSVPGYSYSGITSPMPSKIIIEVRSVGNSSMTAEYNGTLLSNGSRQLYDMPFKNTTSQNVTLPETEGTLIITVMSQTLGITHIFSYKLNVMSSTNFINYEFKITHQKGLVVNFNEASTWGYILLSLASVAFALFMGLWLIPVRWRNKDAAGYQK